MPYSKIYSVVGLALLAISCADSSDANSSVPDFTPATSDDGSTVSSSPASTAADAAVANSDMDCGQPQEKISKPSVDMFILLDQSGSMMEEDDRFTPTTLAIESFVRSTELSQTSVALQYFPLGKSDAEKCEAQRYEVPAVPLAALPANAEPIAASMIAHRFTKENCCTDEHSGTPTRPAVEGALKYMRAQLSQHPDHVGVLLLATDGEPSSVCDGNKIADVAAVLKEAAEGVPAIRTYVIGIGSTDKLKTLASAGGTGLPPFAVDPTGSKTEQDLRGALSAIQQNATPDASIRLENLCGVIPL